MGTLKWSSQVTSTATVFGVGPPTQDRPLSSQPMTGTFRFLNDVSGRGKQKCFFAHDGRSRNQPRHGRLRSCLSFPSRLIRKHERQNDVVQHAHPRRLNFNSCLLFIDEIVWAVELSNHRLLVGGHQLRSFTSSFSFRDTDEPRQPSPLEGSHPSHPTPICTAPHPVQ